jgi:hypothetical protein
MPRFPQPGRCGISHQAMCDFDMATDLVKYDDRVVYRKGKLDSGIYGAIDLLVSRGLSSWS